VESDEYVNAKLFQDFVFIFIFFVILSYLDSEGEIFHLTIATPVFLLVFWLVIHAKIHIL
jgi:hypothetical protein